MTGKLLFYLGSYVREFPRYVQENWRQFYLRPFLTPTSGDVIPEGNDYVIVSHSDFKEVIKRVTIGEEVYHPSNGKEEVRRSFYYAHVGIKKQKKATFSLRIGINSSARILQLTVWRD